MIQEIVNTLSDNEKLIHKDIIQECMDREQQLNELNLKQSLTDFFYLFTLQNLNDDNFFEE
ncbi:MAG: hypothetical protein GY853_16210 [PVC group bacterium]|nr:hypothetical protein [PVC group bacterium]